MRMTSTIMGMLAAVALAGAAPATTGAPAEAVVQKLNASLLDVMKDAGTLDYAARYRRVEPVVDAAFDVPFMAEKSLGRHWKDLTPDERTKWLDLFRRFMVANYAGRFDRYSGQSFEQHGAEEGAYDTVMVQTTLVNPGDENVALNYRLRETDAGWRVVDVYLKGTVSELALRRSDYSAVMKRDGFAALASYLSGKIEALAAGTPR
jgi:phospholipid transport system substrate-binding protein